MNDDGHSGRLGVQVAHPPFLRARALWRGRWVDLSGVGRLIRPIGY